MNQGIMKQGIRPINHAVSRIPGQGPETFLFKMSVVGENIGQSFPAHDLHR
jgi:hypothetical protein